MDRKIAKILRKKADELYKEFARLNPVNNLYNEYKKFWYSLPAMARAMFRKQIEKRPNVFIRRAQRGRHYITFTRFGEHMRPKSRAVYDKHYRKQKQKRRKK